MNNEQFPIEEPNKANGDTTPSGPQSKSSVLDEMIINDIKFIEALKKAEEGPVVIPAENAKPKLARSPKKRSPRLSSKQKRQNRVRRARDERRARRAVSDDTQLPVDLTGNYRLLEFVPDEAVADLMAVEGVSIDGPPEVVPEVVPDVVPDVVPEVVPEKGFLEKRLDSALEYHYKARLSQYSRNKKWVQ